MKKDISLCHGKLKYPVSDLSNHSGWSGRSAFGSSRNLPFLTQSARETTCSTKTRAIADTLACLVAGVVRDRKMLAF